MSTSNDQQGPQAESSEHGLKLFIEMGPLLAAVVAYLLGGFNWATGVLMAGTFVSVIASRVLLGKISPLLLATTAIVIVFGAMTLWLNDPSYIKLKPTLVNLLFAGALLYGLATNRPVLKLLLGEALKLTEDGWRLLSWRWAGFFLALAVANEIVWRNFTDGVWWGFKVAIIPITMAFFALQWGLITKHSLTPLDDSDKSAN